MNANEITTVYNQLISEGIDVASANSLTLAGIVNRATSESAMTVTEAANELRCHPSTIYREVNGGRLNHYRIGNRIRFTREHIDHYRLTSSGNRLACSSQREREVLRLSQS
jgi:excisionase family DNA binding protein